MSDEKKPDYAISFNPDTRQGMFGDADGGPETALVFHNMPCAKDGHMWTGDHFYLLKGDFRNDYNKLIADGEDRWGLKSFYDERRRNRP
jgi:Golgi nucleoside diphosphatase